jgi:hypothetical protein
MNIVISVETRKRVKVLKLESPTAGEQQIYKSLSTQLCGTELNMVVFFLFLIKHFTMKETPGEGSWRNKLTHF